MLNAGSILGRVLPNILADAYGNLNVLTPIAFVCGALAFSMFGLKNVVGVVLFSILYGFFSGARKSGLAFGTIRLNLNASVVISMLSPLIASFANNVDELGYVSIA